MINLLFLLGKIEQVVLSPPESSQIEMLVITKENTTYHLYVGLIPVENKDIHLYELESTDLDINSSRLEVKNDNDKKGLLMEVFILG